MFKDKTSKKRFQNVDITRDLSTLDAMHNKIINNYSKKIIDDKNYIDKINKLEIIYKNINDEIIKYNYDNLKNDNIYSNLWNSNILIKEELILLQNEINNINYFDDVIWEHIHPDNNKTEVDATYLRGWSTQSQDKENYIFYKNNKFESDVIKIKEFE